MSGDLMAELTETQLFELRDAFKLYEEQSEAGKVDLQELGRLLRCDATLELIAPHQVARP